MKQDARRKITPEIMEKMRKLRKEGLSYAKIADELKLGQMTVYNYLKKKEKPAEEKPTEEKKEEKVGFLERLGLVKKKK